ncbi:NAD(P)-dependent alcohol dehydrogenase [Microbispora bryophytorum]|uniref:NADPH:quinone reductase n=1 Tax=Microbispora bryophytorum TaxID=1460882 RepID=A0A8H9L8Y3_9ACTN|nr:NAD(P)-dependent alcohol dehydrogenase [Microbispora bryophytorum]MBD3135486.1 NAD(P)-dependent alcohol dehydrogenase [Microbispora bryophytorum]GGN97932.1 NADPH:quinone reductase [Microbispora bryophytorum]
MKAIVQDTYGPADVLELRDIDRPSIGDEEVLVEVRAAAVDPGVWVLMTGTPYLARAGFGLRRPKVPVRGRDVAGVVTAVGAGVTRFRPGQEVYGTCPTGSLAEYAKAPQARLAPKPADLTFEQAAAVPVSGMTALQAVRDVAGVRPGQRVLVIGASGGVGSFAVQIAKALGASVTGVCAAAKADFVRSLGAGDVIDYTREEIDRDGARYDVVVDTAGNRPLSLLRRALTPRGTLVIVGGGHTAYRFTGGMGRTVRAPLLSLFTGSMFSGRRLRPMFSRERAEHLEELTRLIESGAVVPAIDRAYPLAEAPDAIRHLMEGHPAGKVVVTV